MIKNTKICKKNVDDQTGGWEDRHIILSLRVLDHVACNLMRCTHIWDTRIFSKNRRGWPDRDTERGTVRPIDKHINLTGTHWGPPDPSVGINASQHWTPTMEINTKILIKRPADDQTDIHTYYIDTQEIWSCKHRPQVMCVIIGRANDCQKDTQKTGQRQRETERMREREIDRHSYKLYWTPLDSSGPQRGNKYRINTVIWCHETVMKWVQCM